MIGSFSSAEYLNGEIVCSLTDSLYLGYLNTVGQYGMPNCISFPNDNAIVLLSSQNDAQVDIIGYRNNILDPNFNINKGEFCSYSNDWYMITGNNNSNSGKGGVVLQQNPPAGKPAPSPTSEHLMMGESTNKVLVDIVELLDKIYVFLSDTKGLYNLHTHPAPGGATSPPTLAFRITDAVPDTIQVDDDKGQIKNGANLAGVNYAPLTSED